MWNLFWQNVYFLPLNIYRRACTGLWSRWARRTSSPNPVAQYCSKASPEVTTLDNSLLRGKIYVVDQLFTPLRLDMGGGEHQRERRDLEPTGPPDRTYKVGPSSDWKLSIKNCNNWNYFQPRLFLPEMLRLARHLSSTGIHRKTYLIDDMYMICMSIINMHCNPRHQNDW